MKKHANLAIFVPHLGCQNRCSFCDQKRISGKAQAPTPEEVASLCEKTLAKLGERAKNAEIAFFGGSFTAIDENQMVSLLKAAAGFVGESGFSGIRVSTRPDAVGPRKLELLRAHGVTAVELGVQSMDDRVLEINRRGHTAEDVRDAAGRIREYGFALGVQMMLGLPGDTAETMMRTAEELALLSPDTGRIYPAVVLPGTMLAEWFEKGVYQPLSLDEAVCHTSRIMVNWTERKIKIIRAGLHADPALEREALAGPYHPAFRELCDAKIMLDRLLQQIGSAPAGELRVRTRPEDLSRMLGHRRENAKTLMEMGYRLKVIPDARMEPLFPRLSETEEDSCV